MCPFGFPPNWAEKPLPGSPAESVCMWPEQNRVLVDDRSPPNRLKALRKSTHFLENLQIPMFFFPGQLEISEKIRVFQSTQCFLLPSLKASTANSHGKHNADFGLVRRWPFPDSASSDVISGAFSHFVERLGGLR